ncbi:hypothetical protein D4764_22G0005280 [Takifugu flavidus]|uniref:Uncharacterized protein n=1 Tax=Takifugu flavidus TaxID=433684 RepID=A0A5C6NEC4_9TELE|nr:hypothetical protein D4764_22G0005280 [Takifugu flavidus]
MKGSEQKERKWREEEKALGRAASRRIGRENERLHRRGRATPPTSTINQSGSQERLTSGLPVKTYKLKKAVVRCGRMLRSKKLAKEVAPSARETPANEKPKTTLLPKKEGRYVNFSVCHYGRCGFGGSLQASFSPKRDEVRNEDCSWSREAGISSRNKIGGADKGKTERRREEGRRGGRSARRKSAAVMAADAPRAAATAASNVLAIKFEFNENTQAGRRSIIWFSLNQEVKDSISVIGGGRMRREPQERGSQCRWLAPLLLDSLLRTAARPTICDTYAQA